MRANPGKKKFVCVHLLNDYSGSPRVLAMVISGLRQAGHEVDLITSAGTNGFLSNLDVNYRTFKYSFHRNKWIRLYRFFFSQMMLFLMVMRYRTQNAHLYINTILPFGAALAGKLSGKKVTYHLHESYIQPRALKKFLKTVASFCADSAVYVSNYLLETERLKRINSSVIYNALPDELANHSKNVKYLSKKNFIVLMISSLKAYKGVNEFVDLASSLNDLKFELVLSATEEEIEIHFGEIELPKNLKIFPVQSDVHSFYERASLVVNLSNPAKCVETFGMTLLEAMSFGVPVIGPPAGGPTEIITHGQNGYCIDVRDTFELQAAIKNIYKDKSLQQTLANGALRTASGFSSENLKREVLRTVA